MGAVDPGQGARMRGWRAPRRAAASSLRARVPHKTPGAITTHALPLKTRPAPPNTTTHQFRRLQRLPELGLDLRGRDRHPPKALLAETVQGLSPAPSPPFDLSPSFAPKQAQTTTSRG